MRITRESIQGRHLALLATLAESARKAGARAFLVGGPVRDLLLGAALRDIDVAVEGDAAATARTFAAATGASLRAIDEFLTFKLLLPGHEEVDIATTRRERYTRPGALPLVEPASIEEDLRRRDFSINAIALDIESWELSDPVSGVDDLERGLLRILHPESFSDDPTRIFRGIRLATRLAFGWEADTMRRLDAAIEGDALSRVSRERIWRELVIATEEQRCAGAALLAMAERGALEQILGVGREPDECDALGYLDKKPELLLATGADPRIVRFALLLAGSNPDAELLHGAPFSERECAAMLAIARDPHSLDRALREAGDDASRYSLLDAASAEQRLVTALVDPAVEELVNRFTSTRAVDLAVRGNELGVPEGPWVGAALRATRRAIFTRAISPGEAAAFARRAAVDYLREQDQKE